MSYHLSGKELLDMASKTFNVPKNRITPEQMAYVMDMTKPSTYMLRNHSIANRPVTFSVSNRNQARAIAHRPWQVEPLNDTSRDLAVIKARQLGLVE